MSHFQDFEHEYGPPENCDNPSKGILETYQDLLPEDLLGQWRDLGMCSYRKGLLWFVDPGQFSGILDDWIQLPGPKPLVFLRSAFAHLYFWHDGWVHSLDVQHGSISQVTQRISRMFTLLCDPEIQEKILRLSLFEKALQMLGPPERDECYAFEPALALGGPGTVETIRRVKMREHLAILAQLLHQ